MIISKGTAKPNACPSEESTQSWSKNGGELFPVASGVQAPYVGQADSVFITSRHRCTTPDSEFLSDKNLPEKSILKKTGAKTRLLGDICVPLPYESARNLQNMVPQTRLYLPNISEKRGKRQKKQKMKELSKDLNFSHDVVAFHCSHLLDYDEDELNRTVYRGSRPGQRRYTIGGPSHWESVKNPQYPLDHPPPNKLVHQPKSFVNIDNVMKRELDEILISVAKASKPFRSSIVRSDQDEKSAQSNAEWDEYVLALLSKSTAKLLSDEMSTGAQQTRLVNFLKNRYKEGENDLKEVVSTETQPKEGAEKRRSSKFAAELDKALAEKNLEPHYSPSFTLPAAVGDKKLISDNIFQQEMLAGAFPVRGRNRVPRKSIVLDTNSHLKFEKKLQANFPEDPKKWLHGRRTSKAVKLPGKVVKGLQRWNELPELLQENTYVPSFQTFEKPTKTMREIELMSAHKTRENNNILRIGDEWRSKWMLEKRWQTASTQELIRGMNDINDHVRLAAVAACNKAAELRQRKKAELSFGLRPDKETYDVEKIKKELEPELLDCISKLLEDSCKQVQLTAAVTLCSLNIAEPKAVKILKENVQNGRDIERWLSAQCLTLSGHCEDYIITELLSQTSNTDLLRQEQAAVLLWKLSHQSSLVHAVVAELLNSSSCHDRLVACRLLPRLKGSLNKDVAQKLSHIMWNDWDKTVRTAAAQALGRTGNGKLVHDALLKRLLDENERTKADALRKASGAINTPDDGIITALVKLANEDHSWKVKAHAINALGTIGKITDDVTEMLVWSMRYSKETAVRAEACNAVAKLGLKTKRVLSVLQDRLIVETNEVVRSEAERALRILDVQFTGDLEMLNTIQLEVKRLCKKENVVSSILQRDREENYQRDFERMIVADVRNKDTPQVQERSVKSSESSKRGWDPILAGYQARSALSEPSSPIAMKMERSRLPMDLNSATSEGSQRTKSDLESEYSDSIRSRSTTVDDAENYPAILTDQHNDAYEDNP